MENLFQKLEVLYGNKAGEVFQDIQDFVKANRKDVSNNWISEKDIMLITYGDSIIKKGESPLKTLNTFLKEYTMDYINSVHLLPMFPFSSDDGFSVTNYKEINPDLGNWNDIFELSKKHDLMFDAVINHISVSSNWFQGYLKGEEKYDDYFIECFDNIDYSKVIRPRALPLYYPFETAKGIKNIWATFSNDQVDLNFKNPKVLLDILNILVMYANKGARFIRFDAIGFAWKKEGTTCMHLDETHLLVQVMRTVLDECVKGTIIITETNVPHKENISYLGNGYNEAQMVYQFPLPPLTLHSFIKEDAAILSTWARSLEETELTNNTSYFNFLASHDGIGLRPTEGILSDADRLLIAENVLANGGKINYKNNPDGTKTPYELNINYQDALVTSSDSDEDRIKKFMASQAILLSVIGMPGIYIHSLLGSSNDYEGVKKSGINRRINREKLEYNKLIKELNVESDRSKILTEFLKMIGIRKSESAFSPSASQKVLRLDKRLFSIIRENKQSNERILVIINVSRDDIKINVDYKGENLITNEKIGEVTNVKRFQYMWIKIN